MKNIKRNFIVVSLLAVIMVFGCVFMFSANANKLETAYATVDNITPTHKPTTWNGINSELICNENVTISDPVTISDIVSLTIAAGKTLTLESGLTLNSAAYIDVKGPGKLVISKDNTGSTGALNISEAAYFTVTGGQVIVNVTGESKYGILAGENAGVIVKDGALIVNGGTEAGMKVCHVRNYRGLLRVNATGTDGEETYGIYATGRIVIGDQDILMPDIIYYSSYPTLEVNDLSTNSIGIKNIDTDDDGGFCYYCGFVEVTATNKAIDSIVKNHDAAILSSGNTKANASTTGASLTDKYVSMNLNKSYLTKETDYDYCFTFCLDGKEKSVYIKPTDFTFAVNGRVDTDHDLTDFDKVIKEFFYPALNGPYGTVKDIVVTGGNGCVTATETGFAVSGKFNGTVTISGKYTCYNGTIYTELPFEIDAVISGGPTVTYAADGDTIKATYGTFGTFELKLVAPTELTYDGKEKVATLTDGYNEIIFKDATIEYYKDGKKVDACVDPGTYTAKVTFDGKSAEVNFTINDVVKNEKHGFCLGWIAFIVMMVELVYLALFIAIKIYKNKVLSYISICLSGAIFVFSLAAIILHTCLMSIISLTLALVITAVFIIVRFVYARK